ncbi:MAG TPA: bifunctional demethylmenaquinone methyltransferase/2-methoxy-6-polyprenyl-1,4-benzoquinol methylase UbiE [Candidatus Dormibacteraeota bacterium]|jgi:demethylmenaquinone methyltransferase/2-methoxy-6-polyprenyl-1,4-benzoquinol methylase|nr:bifunctional demethylmenaquinone methyltransferase/2-methoxy-6-polyprenyl-1,4-benzoquinol methylase UbiE [Candidatus Dormibacteraeota bacterium]
MTPGTNRGGSAPQVAPEQVRTMFDQIARFYDLLNTVLSGGRDAAWRRRAAQATGLRDGDTALDVCTGTGKLARLLERRVGPRGTVIGVDFSTAMLDVARAHVAAVDFREGDATTLQGIDDSSVDAVTVAFGLRNVADRPAAMRAALRVLRPGGRCVILEFAHVDVPLFGRVYAWYLTRVLPFAGRLLNPRSGAYSYLPRSIAAYPPAAEVSAELRDAGFDGVRVTRMTLGIVTLHVATRPSPLR